MEHVPRPTKPTAGPGTSHIGRPFDPGAVKTGDVIFIYNKSAGSFVTRLGQTAIRLLYRRRAGLTRYAHVMLGVDPGQVLHANGKITRYDALPDVVKPGAPLKVMRRAEPGLTTAMERLLLNEANRFCSQRYTFIYGRRSSWLGPLVHRLFDWDRTQTLPFCSELVARAYQAAGVKICDVPRDEVLPIDLDERCGGAGWVNVTDSYFEPALNPAVPGFADIWAGSREALVDAARQEAQLNNLKASWFTSLTSPLGLFKGIKDLDLGMAERLAERPVSFFLNGAPLVTHQISRLPDLYRMIEQDFADLDLWSAAGLPIVFPDHGDGAPYEGRPSLDEVKRAEEAVNLAGFTAEVVRTEAILMAMAAAFVDLDPKGQARFEGMSAALAAPHLAALPELARARADQLLAKLPGPLPALVEQRLMVIIEAHLVLLAIRDVLAEATEAP